MTAGQAKLESPHSCQLGKNGSGALFAEGQGKCTRKRSSYHKTSPSSYELHE